MNEPRHSGAYPWDGPVKIKTITVMRGVEKCPLQRQVK